MDERAVLRWPSWIGIVVEDLERQRRFWTDLLDVPEDHSGADFVAFEMGDGRSFELIQRSTEPEYDARRFQVGFDVADIEIARAALIRRGVEPIGAIHPGEGSSWAYFRDPEGNVFEIKQERGRAES